MTINDLSSEVQDAVYQNLGGDYELDSCEKADEIIRKIESLSKNELFDRFLTWHGIIGFTDQIIEAYEGTIGRKDGK
jgi:hypothetical protein